MKVRNTVASDGMLVVTGANGFLGSAIVEHALVAGARVRGTDRASSPRVQGADYRVADIRDPGALALALQDAGVVIHAAGLAHVFSKSAAAQAPFYEVNVTGTANVVDTAAQVGARHVILISSVSVYGGSSREGTLEDTPCRPGSPYALSKWLAEQRAAEIAGQSGLSLTILRLATLYGEGDPGNVARLTRSIDRGRFIWLGNGSNLKSLLHRDDAARACLVASRRIPGDIDVYNVSAPPCTMREIVNTIAAALGRRVPAWHIPAGVTRLLQWAARLSGGLGFLTTLHSTAVKWLADDVYDGSKFEQHFDYRTQVRLADGLRREVNWYLAYGRSRSSFRPG